MPIPAAISTATQAAAAITRTPHALALLLFQCLLSERLARSSLFGSAVASPVPFTALVYEHSARCFFYELATLTCRGDNSVHGLLRSVVARPLLLRITCAAAEAERVPRSAAWLRASTLTLQERLRCSRSVNRYSPAAVSSNHSFQIADHSNSPTCKEHPKPPNHKARRHKRPRTRHSRRTKSQSNPKANNPPRLTNHPTSQSHRISDNRRRNIHHTRKRLRQILQTIAHIYTPTLIQ